MDKRFESMDKRLANFENQMMKNNAAIGELMISVIRLADEKLKIR